MPGPAAQVFAQLLHELPDRTSSQVHWDLRIFRDANAPQGAFVFPDGGVYIDGEMAWLLDGNAGLWAALLSHGVSHVTLYHWTKVAAMQDLMADPRDDWKFLTLNSLSLSMQLQPTAQETQQELAAFSQDLEMHADAAGLQLMVRAGFHPDFMTALYHLMQVQGADSAASKSFA
jgi:predicted Zn-dependent protease